MSSDEFISSLSIGKVDEFPIARSRKDILRDMAHYCVLVFIITIGFISL
jgi:hypothetical protein